MINAHPRFVYLFLVATLALSTPSATGVQIPETPVPATPTIPVLEVQSMLHSSSSDVQEWCIAWGGCFIYTSGQMVEHQWYYNSEAGFFPAMYAWRSSSGEEAKFLVYGWQCAQAAYDCERLPNERLYYYTHSSEFFAYKDYRDPGFLQVSATFE